LERRGAAGFAAHRAKRILVPFVVAVVPTMASLYYLMRWGAAHSAARPEKVWNKYQPLEVPPPDAPEPSPCHLWFLYYLLFLFAGVLVLSWAGRRLPMGAAWERADRLVRRLAGSWALPFVLALPTAAALACMRGLDAETPVTFVPVPRILAYYATFFAFGWLLHRQADLVGEFGRRLPLRAAGAALVLPAVLYFLDRIARTGTLEPPALRGVAVYLLALLSWLLVFVFVGLFVRYLARPRPWVRYLADASYWCYLIHLPVAIFFQILVAESAWPGPVKYGGIMAATLAVCLGTYALFVRYTFLGTALNGKRARPAPQSVTAETATD
jgi:peptidoglycan/LPS O-acetylase OafA/YrhL